MLAHVYRPSGTVAATLAIRPAMQLAGYVRRARAALAALPSTAILGGEPAFVPIVPEAAAIREPLR